MKKIKITIGDKVLTASIYDNPTAQDFLKLLPLKVKLKDHASTEKIFYPSRKLTTQGAPKGSDPSVGDIAYYAPWGNVVLYYKDFSFSDGLVLIGKIDSGVELLQGTSELEAGFEVSK